MSQLHIFDENGGELERLAEHDRIAERLGSIGVRFERWSTQRALAPEAGEDEVLAAYAESIERLGSEFGFRSVDVVSLRPDHPQREAMRAKFLDEHTHDDFEVRFFVEGKGLFYLRAGERVFAVLCTRGDLISVPAGMRHWFDMGTEPDFKCIRFFTVPEGWLGNFTGSDFARRFPEFDSLARQAA